ncbi:MAG TPA: hypothetical protein VGD79_00795 [Thermoanaerobaculia bacterium]|jgi:hypothetical protein
MKLPFRALLLVVAQSMTVFAFAQSGAPTVAASDPLATILPSCGGAWEAIRRASAEVHVLDVPMTREAREQILCLLGEVDKKTFDKDPQYDNLMAVQVTQIIVAAYSRTGLDFFAEQLPQQPARVRRGLATALLSYGHPVAIRQYFDARRAKLARGETLPGEASIAVALFRPYLENGNCGDGRCSEHLAETLGIIQANLDIVDMELAAVEKRPTPQSRSPQTAVDAQKERDAASRLRGLVGRIQRGEVPIGTAGRTK